MRLIVVLTLATLLNACSTAPATRAFVDAARLLKPSGAGDVAIPQLDPRFAYLRLERDSRVRYLALGYVDPHPDGDVEVWYTSAGEVLRLQDGRVVGSSGGETDWLAVRFEGRPRWREVKGPVTFVRIRDVQPGYRFGLRETLTLRQIPAPADSRLRQIAGDTLTWFEERAEAQRGLPPSRYAVSFAATGDQVVYAEHCLSPVVCFSWQRWPVPKREQP